jgi:phosphoribosyl 1,2-cyclic phosphodiesterase
MDKKHFLIVDDDKEMLELLTVLLERKGHQVSALISSEEALEKVSKINPDCIISDLIMPKISGIELFEKIHNLKDINQPKFIIVTVRQYDFDKRRALQAGIDGYIYKPIDVNTFADEVTSIVEGEIVVTFWGVRGTLPVPGRESIRYGGNTNCVTLSIAEKYLFIFDAGTGIKSLSTYLIKENAFPLSAKIFITHPHYDHINGLPFFVPLYLKGNEFEIFGTSSHGIDVQKYIEGQMDSVYFPVTTNEFSSKITFHNLSEESFNMENGIKVDTINLNHPGGCIGYRVTYRNKIFCYITDNEIMPDDSPASSGFDKVRLINFIQNADLVVIDSTYTDSEYEKKMLWGHSSISQVVDVLAKAHVKVGCLYHHDPDQTDDDIDKKLHQAQALLKKMNSNTICIAPHEGDSITI